MGSRDTGEATIMKARIADTRCEKTSDHALSDRVTGQMALDNTVRNPILSAFTRSANTVIVNWSGFYWVQLNVQFANVPNPWEWGGVGLRVNGVQDSWYAGFHGVDSTNTRVNTMSFHQLVKGDVLDVVRYQAQTPGASMTGATTYTWIEIVRLDD